MRELGVLEIQQISGGIDITPSDFSIVGVITHLLWIGPQDLNYDNYLSAMIVVGMVGGGATFGYWGYSYDVSRAEKILGAFLGSSVGSMSCGLAAGAFAYVTHSMFSILYQTFAKKP